MPVNRKKRAKKLENKYEIFTTSVRIDPSNIKSGVDILQAIAVGGTDGLTHYSFLNKIVILRVQYIGNQNDPLVWMLDFIKTTSDQEYAILMGRQEQLQTEYLQQIEGYKPSESEVSSSLPN